MVGVWCSRWEREVWAVVSRGVGEEERWETVAGLLFEGLRRLKHVGATQMPMTGGFDPFYEAIGFRKVRTCYPWVKKFGEAQV